MRYHYYPYCKMKQIRYREVININVSVAQVHTAHKWPRLDLGSQTSELVDFVLFSPFVLYNPELPFTMGGHRK